MIYSEKDHLNKTLIKLTNVYPQIKNKLIEKFGSIINFEQKKWMNERQR